MRILRAYKTELDPTPEQKISLGRHAGAMRWVYNWGLAYKIAARERGEKVPSAKTLDGMLRKLKDSGDDMYAWLNDIPSHPRQAALANLDAAYKNFFERIKNGKRGRAVGFPKFKSRKRGDSVGIRHFSYSIEGDRINVSRISSIKLKERDYMPSGKYGLQPCGSRFYGLTITERAGRWFASVQVEIEIADSEERPTKVIGVDVGIKSLATVSDGRAFENPKATRRFARKLRRAQKRLSRRVKGSHNREKARRDVARIQYRLSNVRKDAIHKATTEITREPSVIAIESLNVSGMLGNRRIAKAVADASMSEFLRQLQYKAKWNGSEIIEVSQWMPSSKTCCECAWRHESLSLSDRVFVCEGCGLRLDRDLNAARNLAKFARSYRENQNACGVESSGTALAVPVLDCESGTQTHWGESECLRHI